MQVFEAAYDPERFRAFGHQLVDTLAEHLAQVQRREGPVLPWLPPEQALQAWPAEFPASGGRALLPLITRILEASNHLQHPRYVGHQCASPLPMAALVGSLRDLLNNGCAVYEMGPVGTAMERAVVQWLMGRAGFDPTCGDGILTHGGSAGNLTALLAARQASASWDVWEEGHRTQGLVLVTGDQAHYSVRRAAQILGLGGRSVIPVPTDERFRMRPDELASTLDALARENRCVMAVVASAGSTATGAIDPLETIADICQARHVWLHVDGAHSGAFVVSDHLRPALRGIERADSLVIDFHKMLLMPSLATAVLFKQGDHSYETFSQQASYLFDRTARQEWYNLAHRTLECTKRSLAMDLYLALQVHGTDFFAAHVDRMVNLAKTMASHLRARPHWELAVPPEGNIVCFRYAPPGTRDVDGLQASIRDALVKEGSFYLVKTALLGHTWLRTTLIHPLTTEADLVALLDRIEDLAGQLSNGIGR